MWYDNCHRVGIEMGTYFEPPSPTQCCMGRILDLAGICQAYSTLRGGRGSLTQGWLTTTKVKAVYQQDLQTVVVILHPWLSKYSKVAQSTTETYTSNIVIVKVFNFLLTSYKCSHCHLGTSTGVSFWTRDQHVNMGWSPWLLHIATCGKRFLKREDRIWKRILGRGGILLHKMHLK